jgi:hypothetical protein
LRLSVGSNILAQQQLSQEQPGAKLGVDKAGVLAHKAQTSLFRKRALQQWPGIYVRTIFEFIDQLGLNECS